jgi:DNA-binding transcriptional regulator YdaS (Cro superfamily)
MARPRSNPVKKTADLVRAEEKGQKVLYEYCRAKAGVQANLVRATGIYPATISKMSNGKTPISMDAAILLEVATGGVLKAAILCPARAELFAQFKALA